MKHKTNPEKLYLLHERLTDYFLELLESGKKLTQGEIAGITKFLKDNEITADFTDSSTEIGSLVEKILQDEVDVI
jgi:hypothetical protein